MTRQLTPFTLPVSKETIMIIPVSLTAEAMLTRRQFPAPKPPAVKVEIGGISTVERNAADPNYLEAYKIYENELNLEVTERIIRKIALKQSLTQDQLEEIAEMREALEGLEQLPKSDKILWMFKFAIGADQDIRAILEKAAELADPTKEGIEAETNGF